MAMPKEEGLDHTLAFLKEGYEFILHRRKSFQSDVFETTLLGKKAICLGGKEGAELFYDTDKFIRAGAAPNRLVKTLFGEGGVQTLDGEQHRNRKEMFMSIMTRNQLQKLDQLIEREWDRASEKWDEADQIKLYEASHHILMKAACGWAGVPLDDEKKRTEQMRHLFEAPAALGASHWQGRVSRSGAEKWISELVQQVRSGDLHPIREGALYVFSWHRDADGELLPAEVAAVEVLNILRPIVAISIYIVFAALALHQFPEEKKRLERGDGSIHRFVQEVRRFYPFFPATLAKVKKDFEWNGYQFKEGTMTLLDLYGNNHDPHLWEQPDLFRPERFLDWDKSPFDFIPQGGGDFGMGHRCAGEWVTIQVMEVSVDFLVNKLRYTVPEQDLSYSHSSMPSMPKSQMILTDIRKVSS
ncbi:cytochrome P450 [Terribacillus sp. 7520-G]|uniref:cytochrome P450 n=1 Tax=Terribacillus sp. 7520-G TaxID=2025389 RepID=UPI000BA7C367|nr:cytochrome P450 [Terribacillus sp. 7520-G]PAD40559.1 cytochrome P450 [Terribacillus sp. 7520-G]